MPDEGFPASINSTENKKVERHIQSRAFYEHFLRGYLLDPNDYGKLGNSLRDVRFYPGIEKEGGKLKYILYLCNKMFGYIFITKKDEFQKILSGLGSRTYTNDEEMIDFIVSQLSDFASTNFTRQELEKNYRENRKGKIPINEIMDCNRDKKNLDDLRVHLLATSEATAHKVMEGFITLAEMLKNASEGSDLKKIKTISLTSWIFYEKPTLITRFEKLGFTSIPINEHQEKAKKRRMEISREKFIEIFTREKP